MNLRKTLSVMMCLVLLCITVPAGLVSAADPYTVTDIQGTTNTDKVIAPLNNILVYATGSCTYFDAYSKYTTTSPNVLLYDGKLSGVADQESGTRWSVYNRDLKKVWVSYDLGEAYKVDSFLVAGNAGDQGVYGFDIYVGDADADTIKANEANYSPVYTTDDTVVYGRRIELDDAVTGSKVVFCFNNATSPTVGQIWLSELGVTGTPAVLPYTVTDITADANVDKIIAAEDNVLSSATGSCTYYGWSSADNKNMDLTVTPPAHLQDGKLGGVGESTSEIWKPRDQNYNKLWVTYTLDGLYDVASIMVAGAGNYDLGEGCGIYSLRVYIGDTDATTIKANEQNYKPVYTTEDDIVFGRRIDLKTPVRGSKIVFCLEDYPYGDWNAGQIFVSELAATGTKVVLPYTVTDITTNSNGDAIIDPEDNILISGRSDCAYYGWSAENNKNMNLSVNTPAHLQDGKLGGIGESTSEIWRPRDQNYDKLWVTYTLDGIYDVESFLVAGAGSYDLAEGCGIYDLKVYIGNADATTIKANEADYTPIYETTEDIIFGRRIDLKAPVRGSRIVFCLGDYPYGNWNAGQIFVTELTAAGIPIITGLTNLIAGKEPVDTYVADRGKPDRYNEEHSGWLEDKVPDPSTIRNMTDGNYTTRHAQSCTCTTRLLDPDLRKYISVDTPWAVYVFHLGGTATVGQITMTSTGEPGNYFLAGVDYYVGQTLKTLFDEENRVYTTQGEKTLVNDDGEEYLDPAYDVRSRVISATLDTPKTGRYVALVVTRPHATDCLGYSQARIDEFEVMGTLEEENVEKLPQTTFTDPDTGCSMTLDPYNFDDVDIYNRVSGLRVTRIPCPDNVVGLAGDNWLMVDPSDRYIYQFDLVDKDGNPLDEADYGTRTVDVTVPGKSGYMQVFGTIDDHNDMTRVVNSRIDDGQLIGENVAGRRLVRLVINESLVKWSGVADDDNDVVAGVSDAEAKIPSAIWLWLLPAMVAVAAAVLLTVRRRRVR